MRECQKVYELILGRDIDNFRRKISQYVEPTELKLEGKQFNPATLYKLKKDRVSNF